MKIVQYAFSFFTFLMLSAPLSIFGDNSSPNPIPVSTNKSLIDFYQNVICPGVNWVFAFVVILAVFFLLYSAFLFFSAGGDSAKVSKARSFLVYGMIGVAIAVLSKAIVFITADFVGAPFPASGFGCTGHPAP